MPVEEVVPNTLMREVIKSGRPILVDLLTNKAGTFPRQPHPAARRRRAR